MKARNYLYYLAAILSIWWGIAAITFQIRHPWTTLDDILKNTKRVLIFANP